jgi:hypothetical protein
MRWLRSTLAHRWISSSEHYRQDDNLLAREPKMHDIRKSMHPR